MDCLASGQASFPPQLFSQRANYTDMLSLINAKKTTLIFPDAQNLWTFFSMAEVSGFRIESSRHVFIGKLSGNDIEFAKQRLGASEEKKNKHKLITHSIFPILHFHLLKYAFRCMF